MDRDTVAVVVATLVGISAMLACIFWLAFALAPPRPTQAVAGAAHEARKSQYPQPAIVSPYCTLSVAGTCFAGP